MDDFYIEQIVPRKPSPLMPVVKTIWIALTIALFFGGFISRSGVLLIAGLVVAFGGYYFILPNFSVEYEYLYMSRELSVDKILDKQKRKKFDSWDLTNMEIMAPLDSYRLKEYENRQTTLVNVSSGREDASRYVIIINDKKNTRLVIEPNDELLKAISDQFPRKVFKD